MQLDHFSRETGRLQSQHLLVPALPDEVERIEGTAC
jgi:hypothetical protein